ncbi:MAG: [FeFe] hydrogenase H-cluster radical SAM maturase HydE [Actinomycetaceae bacterium]|nr:[FeFe] hydrogenase H-cluster radical SAM maturase HydE [Actinomycetaceae bacterium]
MKHLVDKLEENHELTRDEWVRLISSYGDEDLREYAASRAREASTAIFGKNIYFRGIIEYTNFCRNDCYYCGLRLSAPDTTRYRLTPEQIMDCADEGYRLGYRTIVLQGGETAYFEAKNGKRMVDIVRAIKTKYSDVAITLSMGEMKHEVYQALFDAGADRYLLRHETASADHYKKLHPEKMSFDNRMACLQKLRDIGFQAGPGMMIGSPGQGAEELAEDMLFISRFEPHMVGMGPFQPHHATPFHDQPSGSVELTLFIVSLVRLLRPKLLLPATTALDCDVNDGRQRAILAGANVIMPNLSPEGLKKNYLLYDNKPGITQSAEENLVKLRSLVEEIGYTMVVGRGDHPDRVKEGV